MDTEHIETEVDDARALGDARGMLILAEGTRIQAERHVCDETAIRSAVYYAAGRGIAARLSGRIEVAFYFERMTDTLISCLHADDHASAWAYIEELEAA